MAKRPLETHDVEGLSGPEYELNILCAAPGCMERSQDVHHLWRRSFLGGPFNWVILPDDSHVGNVVGLCRPHHEQIEAGAAWITLESDKFIWSDLISASQQLGFQPPHTLGNVAEERAELAPPMTMLSAPEPWIEDLSGPLKENECPSCRQPLPRPKVDKPREEKRVRRTWSITVPVDHREDGANALDTLLEEARTEMAKVGIAYSDASTARYHVLATALGLFVQHFDSVVANA